MAVTSHPWLDIFIGTVVSIVSSILNAAGLNLLKLDHVRNRALVMERQRQDCSRPRWLVGLALYLVSQIFGSAIALNFLKTQWVAPLGSLALIFNFVFAKILVGTKITQQDILGTFIVMASVIWIVTFGGMNTAGADVEDSLTILELKALFSRVVFIIYFSILNLVIIALLSLGTYAYWTITLDESILDPTTERLLRKKMKMKLTALLGKNRIARASGLTLQEDEEQDGVVIEERELALRDLRMRKVVAMIMATCGGVLASQTLLLAKSGIKLITSSIPGAGPGNPGALPRHQSQNQFQDPLSFSILFLLVLTAVFQVLCLNTALKLYDSVLVVPMFYGFYTTFGLVNSIIYLNQFSDYQPWVLLLIILGIALLILGVRMLSSPKSENESPVAGPSFEARQQPDHHGEPEGSPKDEGTNQLFRISDKDIQVPLEFSEEGGHTDGTVAEKPWTATEPQSLDSSASSRFRFLENLSDRINRKRVPSSTMTTAVVVKPCLGLVVVNSLHGTVSEDEDPKSSSLVQSNQHTNPDSLQESRQAADPLHAAAYERGRKAVDGYKRPAPPRIDTLTGPIDSYPTASYTRGRSETRRPPLSPSARHSSPVPRPMSPSEFRAQYTNSPFPIKPKHLQDSIPGQNGSRSSSPKAWNEGAGNQESLSMQRSHSPMWLPGGAKIDQVFEDLNPFKKFRRNSADGSVFLRGHGNGSVVGDLHAKTRRTSLSRLPSEWDEAATNRKLKHSTLFGEHGSRQSSTASSPAVSQYSTPSHSRRQSTTTEVVVGSEANTGRMIEPLDSALKDMNRDYHGPKWQQQQRQLRQSSTQQQQSPVTSTRTHGRQLSFTTKNDGRGSSGSNSSGMAAALASVGLSVTGPPHFASNTFGSASGTFGPPSKNRTFKSSNPETSQPPDCVEDTQTNFLPLSVQLQLQQLSQLQHYPTSQLQHSMTTSSVSTIGSTTFSTETSLAQFLAQGTIPPQPPLAMAGYVESEDEHGSLD